MWWLWLIIAVVLLFGFVVFRGAPYVPSRRRELQQAFTELYPLGSDDVLFDIGSGDGVVLREAAAHGARAVGVELNPVLVWISRWLSRGQTQQVSVQLADFWRTQLPDETTVVYVFGESRDITRMMRRIAGEAARIGRPLSVISYGFQVPGYEPVNTAGAYFLYRVEPPLQSGQA